MQIFVHQLLSKGLGRVVATVILEDLDVGTVLLAAEGPDPVVIEFDFVLETVQRVIEDAKYWPEIVVRMAVAQAHKLLSLPLDKNETLREPLNLCAHPWIGGIVCLPDAGGDGAGSIEHSYHPR